MIKINLLPVKEAKKKQKVVNQVIIGALLLLAAIGVMAWLQYDKVNTINDQKTRIEELKKEIDKLKDVEKTLNALEKRRKDLDNQINAIKSLSKGRDWFIRILDKITESVPPNMVWIESIDMKGKGDNIVVKGKAYDKDSIALYMGNLAIIPCDDDKDEKADVCIERNDRCKKSVLEVDETAGKYSNFKHSSCKDFYKEKEQKLKDAKAKHKECIDDCAKSKCIGSDDVNCVNTKKGECKGTCKAQENEVEKLEKQIKKLHEEEYVKYDSIELKVIKSKKQSRGAVAAPVYDFEIHMNPKKP